MDNIINETYLINMDKEVERLKTFDEMMSSKHLPDLSWKYIRVSAINGKELRDNICIPQKDTISNLINCKQTLYYPNNIFELQDKYVSPINWLSSGEVGCLMSHVMLWEKVASEEFLNRIAVFEDDARTHMDIQTINKLILDLYKYLEDNYIPEPDMLYLGKALDDCLNYKKVWNNVYYSKHPLCLHSYIITKNGARKLLEKLPYNVAIDIVPIQAINDINLNVMTFHPSLYFQDVLNTESSLRKLGNALNITAECLIDQQHISNNDLKFLGVLIIMLFVVCILCYIYLYR